MVKVFSRNVEIWFRFNNPELIDLNTENTYLILKICIFTFSYTYKIYEILKFCLLWQIIKFMFNILYKLVALQHTFRFVLIFPSFNLKIHTAWYVVCPSRPDVFDCAYRADLKSNFQSTEKLPFEVSYVYYRMHPHKQQHPRTYMYHSSYYADLSVAGEVCMWYMYDENQNGFHICLHKVC